MKARTTGRFGAVALGVLALGASGCGSDSKSGGSGGSGDEGQIKTSIQSFVKNHDCTLATPTLRKELTGQTAVKACSHDLGLRNKVKKLKIDNVTVSGATAKSEVTTDGQKVNVDLVKQGGKWLLSTVGT